MKRNWDTHELEEHFTLSTEELHTTQAHKTKATRLGFAVLFKTFDYQGRFPQTRAEVPAAVLAFLAHQLDVAAATESDYAWEGRTFERHRAVIRQRLGFREATATDAEALTNGRLSMLWLRGYLLWRRFGRRCFPVAVRSVSSPPPPYVWSV